MIVTLRMISGRKITRDHDAVVITTGDEMLAAPGPLWDAVMAGKWLINLDCVESIRLASGEERGAARFED